MMSEHLSTAAEPRHTGEWRRYALFVALLAAGIIGLFQETVSSMVSIWYRSETFTHGFLILPIALWLVWEKREHIVRSRPAPDYRVLLLTLPLGLGWLLGQLVDVLVVQQFAFVGLLITALWALLGNAAARQLAFPLGFLFFAVPVGEGLIPPMMDFTADFTVAMIQYTGIPVYREGTFFSIPSGDWSVVEGCSGVRYLIASVTLGVLYAYLTYTNVWKRILFILVSIVVPIFANGMRAYLIVMIAHLSDMKLALGVDHFIYGWVFFGIVITILFLLGAIWRDPVPALPAPSLANAPIHRTGSPLAASLLVLLATAIWPLTALTLGRDLPPHAPGVELPAPPGAAGWQAVEGSDWDWRPETLAPDAERYQFYRRDGHTVGLSLGLYLTQRQDAELVNSQNMLVRQKHPVWSNKGRDQARIDLAGSTTTVDQAKLVSARQRLLVWHWYRVGATYTSNPYLAKVLEALSRLTGGRRDGVLISLATPYENRTDEAKPVLQAFLADMLPQVEAVLDRAARAQ